MKQTTGREVKTKGLKIAFDPHDNFGMAMPTYQDTHGQPKGEKVIDEDSENYEQTPKSLFAMKAAPIYKRPGALSVGA